MNAYVDITLLMTTFLTLFVIMDPPGLVPVYLALTSTQTSKQRKKAAFQATTTSLGVMATFTVFGQYILNFLQISLPALQVSGGLLLLIVAMELLAGKDGSGDAEGATKQNVALVPLATPLMAGPGSIVAIMVAWQRAPDGISSWTAIGIALIAIHLVLWLSMRFADIIHRVLGTDGTLLVTRLAGMLLAAIAVEILASGIFSYLAAHQ